MGEPCHDFRPNRRAGPTGDLMRLNGWKSRAIVDRYADDVANQRALGVAATAAGADDGLIEIVPNWGTFRT
jgi:hypothetical protein